MKSKFTKKIARSIADTQFDWVLDCLLGNCDPDWSLCTDTEIFEQEFTEALEDANITATPARIKIISDIYDTKVAKAKSYLEKLYSKKS